MRSMVEGAGVLRRDGIRRRRHFDKTDSRRAATPSTASGGPPPPLRGGGLLHPITELAGAEWRALPPALNRETKPGQGATRREAHITDLADHLDLASHGGALDAARALFPDAPEPWIDLSTGINPWAYPVGPLAREAWERLPEASALAALEASAARRYLCPASAVTVAAPGTQAIIQLLPALLGGSDIRVRGATYGEFARVFALAGAKPRLSAELDDLAGADVAIVVNPNNPDGRLVTPEALLALAPRVGTLVVDEAFIDALAPAPSLIPLLPARRTMVLRSFGKFYGLAGLRLGFAVTSPDLAQELRDRLGPWAVSGPAMEIGARALADDAWPRASRERLSAAAQRLDGALIGAGFEIVGGTPLFRLARHPRAPQIFRALAEAGILTRPFAAELDWLRFGLPDGEGAWDRLIAALEGF